MSKYDRALSHLINSLSRWRKTWFSRFPVQCSLPQWRLGQRDVVDTSHHSRGPLPHWQAAGSCFCLSWPMCYLPTRFRWAWYAGSLGCRGQGAGETDGLPRARAGPAAGRGEEHPTATAGQRPERRRGGNRLLFPQLRLGKTHKHAFIRNIQNRQHSHKCF